jgi:hypothetical protein
MSDIQEELVEVVDAEITAEEDAPVVEEEVVEEAADVEEEKAEEIEEDAAEAVEAKTLTQKLIETQGQITSNIELIEAKTVEIAALEAKITRLTEQAEEREIVIAEQQVEVVEAEELVEAMKASLANPAAFADAVDGEQEPVADGGSGEEESATSLKEQYNAITDPKERSRFWKAHNKEMNKE